MYRDTVEKFAEAAKNKSDFLKNNPLKYFISSTMAGVYVGFGIILIFSVGAPFALASAAGVKIIMGISFGIALTLVIIAGSELFTGNNMIMIIGKMNDTASWHDTGYVWLVSFTGNLAGALGLAFLMSLSGLITDNNIGNFITKTASIKMNTPFLELFIRGILCNMLICLAVWMSARVKEDTAKILVIFLCLFAFISSGFEHSVANMTLLGTALSIKHPDTISWLGFFKNLIPVTLGNIIGGGIFIGAMYSFISKTQK